MNLYQKRNILVVLMVLWLILSVVCGHIFSGDIPTLISIPSFAGWFYLYLRWWQCPCCLRSLGRLQISDITCPHCRKKIPKKIKPFPHPGISPIPGCFCWDKRKIIV